MFPKQNISLLAQFIGSRHNLGKIEKDPTIKIRSETVNRVHTSKSLGVIIDDKLKWKNQIDSISKNLKVSREIGAIKLIKPYLPKKCLTQLYNAPVQPYFDYCSLVWQNSRNFKNFKIGQQELLPEIIGKFVPRMF